MSANNVEVYSFAGLWNRQTFCNETAKIIRSAPEKKYVILRWDIDQFAVFNYTYGSRNGDNVIREVASRQLERYGSIQSIVSMGHYNADHFVMCYVDGEISPEDIMQSVIEDLNNSFAESYFSIHVGLCPVDDSIDIGLCCDRALIAIRKAKKDYNKHIAWYDSSMRADDIVKNKIFNEMHDALNNGEFKPWVQPQYDYSTGNIIGAEVLVRWMHPTDGIIPPNSFIPVFERSGFIYDMDKYICEQACICMRKWIDKGYNLPSLSINVSRYDIYRNTFLSDYLGYFEKYSIPHDKIHIELTESAYTENPEKMIAVINELRRNGFVVEMDDFGSGYSSLNALKDLSTNIIKLDMGFIRNDTNLSRGGSIVASIVNMARLLEIDVIAEGVETKAQADFLKSIGCLNMQGYFFSKPIPITDFEKLISAQDAVKTDTNTPHGVDNAADFLDASSQTTLLFNSFLGGAGIVAYDNGKATLLRVNDKFFEALNISHDVYEKFASDYLKVFNDENKNIYTKMLDDAYSSGNEKGCETMLTIKKKPYWLYSRARFLAKKGDIKLFYVALENITARKSLEMENQRLSGELAAIVENLPGGIAIFDVKNDGFTCQYISGAFYRQRGYDAKDVAQLSKDIVYSVVDDDKKMVLEKIHAAVHDGKPFYGIYRIRTKSNEIIWVESRSSYVGTPENGLLYMYSNDITDRILADEELRTSGEEYRASALQSGKMVCRYIVKNRALVVSPEVARVFDSITYQEEVAKTFVDKGYVSEESVAKWLEIFDSIERGEKIGRSTVRLKKLHGGFKWYYVMFTTIFDQYGKPERAVLSFEDITEKRERDKYKDITQEGIIKALQSVYPLVIVCNLSKNSYNILEYDNFINKSATINGEYDNLIDVGVSTIPYDKERQAFKNLFSKENVVAEFIKGHDVIKFEHHQVEDSGEHIHWMETIVMRVPDEYDDDVVCISVSRCIDESKIIEEKLNEALHNVSGELKVNEAENEIKLSMARLGKMISRYDIKTHQIVLPKEYASKHGIPMVIYAPQEEKDLQRIMPNKQYQKKYYDMFKSIESGKVSGTAEFLFEPEDVEPFWEKAEFVNVFDDNNKPVRTVISIEDTTASHKANAEYDQIKKNEQIMRIVAEHSERIVYFMDINTGIAYAIDSERALKVGLGSEFNTVSRKGRQMECAPDSVDTYHELRDNVRAGKKSGSAKFHILCVDGKDRWFDICYSLLITDGKVGGAVVSLLDITTRHEEEVAFARYQQSSVQKSKESLIYVEADLTDNTLERFGGTDLKDMDGIDIGIGDNYFDTLVKYVEYTFPQELQQRIMRYFSREHLMALFADGKREISDEWHVKYSNAGMRWVEASIQLVADPYSGHIKSLLTVKDITNEKDEYIEAQRRAQLDGLTGIYNRSSTEMLIEKHLSEPDTITSIMIMIDMDNLKEINDTFGHQEGDRALKLFATTLKRHFRNTDIVGRLGGDEFMAYLPGGKNEAAIRSSLEVLIKKVHSISVGNDEKRINLSFSAGCCIATPEFDTFNAIFKRADTALYHVKRNGKDDYVFYTDSMQLSSYKYEGRRTVTIPENETYDSSEVKRLLNSMSQFYPMIMSVNLAKDYYYLMESTDFIEKIIPKAGSYKSFLTSLNSITKKSDRTEINKLVLESIIEQFYKGNKMMHILCRQINEDGRYIWNDWAVLLYNNDANEICAFLFCRESVEKEKDERIVRLQKVMDVAIKSSFEYICIVNVENGRYEIFGNDGDNTHNVPDQDEFDKVTRDICEAYVVEEERDEYYHNAIIETVVKKMDETDGHYKYRYTMFDGPREAEFHWYEPTHKELLMTVKKINK